MKNKYLATSFMLIENKNKLNIFNLESNFYYKNIVFTLLIDFDCYLSLLIYNQLSFCYYEKNF